MSQDATSFRHRMGITLLRIAAVYLLVGLAMGLVMGIANDFTLASVHAHISLLGWATMSITGFVYLVRPACRESRLALVHFWGHNLGLPVMMAGLALERFGYQAAEKGIAAGSVLVIGSLAAFTVNVFRNGGWERAGSAA